MNDLKFGLRQLLKNPAFTVVAIVSLAIGIGLNSAVFSIINAVFYQTIRGVPEPRRVVLASERISYPAYRLVKEQAASFSGVATSGGTEAVMQWANEATRDHIPAVSANTFQILGVRPFLGRFFDDAPSALPNAAQEAVLDYQFWRNRWDADPSVIGQTITLNGHAFTVVGVAPKAFHGFGPERPSLWAPIGTLPLLEQRGAEWGNLSDLRYGMFARLRTEASLEEAQAELAVLLGREPGMAPPKPVLLGAGRETWTGGTSVEKQAELLLVTVVPLLAVGSILWIACSNVANLLLARAVARRREIAIRLATGASRWRVVRLLLTESFLLAFLGGALGLFVSGWTVDFVFATFSNFGSLAAPIDGRVMAYTAGICVLSTLLFGLVPALQASRADVATALKTEGSGSISGGKRSRIRSFFLVTQVAGSLALLVITATFVRSLVSTRFGESAREMDHLLVAQLPDAPSGITASEMQRQVREQIGALPGVRQVTLGESGRGEATQLFFGNEEPTNAPSATVHRIDDTFFSTVGITLLRGRNLASRDASKEDVLVNEAAAKRFWPGGDPVGKRFAVRNDTTVEVVGIVRDRNDNAQLYRPFAETVMPKVALVSTLGPSEKWVGPVRQVLQRLASERSFPQVATVREAQSRGLGEITTISMLVGGIALLLAASGLYGSMAFSSSQRTREMGIRIALGAKRGEVLRLLIGDGFRIAAIGGVIGLVLIAIAFQFMTGLIFGKWTLEPSVVVGVIALFGLVTLLACWLPARRAARVDPMVALRNE